MASDLNVNLDPSDLTSGVNKVVSDLERLKSALGDAGAVLSRRVRVSLAGEGQKIQAELNRVKSSTQNLTSQIRKTLDSAQVASLTQGEGIMKSVATGLVAGRGAAVAEATRSGKAIKAAVEKETDSIRASVNSRITGVPGVNVSVRGADPAVVNAAAAKVAQAFGGITQLQREADKALELSGKSQLALAEKQLALKKALLKIDADRAKVAFNTTAREASADAQLAGLRGVNQRSFLASQLLQLPGGQEEVIRRLGSAYVELGSKVRGLSAAQIAASVVSSQVADTTVRDSRRAFDALTKEASAKAQLAGLNRGAARNTFIASQLLQLPGGEEEVVRRLGASYLEAGTRAKGLAAEQLIANKAVNKFTVDAGDARSAARGLASAFDAVYLTYGRLVPLLVGAAIGGVVVQTVRLGAQVDNTLQTIRVLSEESAGAVNNLNQQLLNLSRSGPFGPLEVAEAMKVLSLAGLNATEVSSGIVDVLNFAVAGNTSIAKSADVLTSVSTAFKIGVEGYSYVGDVIAKTAAISKSSVDSIGEAFKTASVINSQFGVSLKDAALGLAALSNVGIQGSAAGTALRNFYSDIVGRTPAVTAALKKIGLDARDLEGNIKPVVQIVKEFEAELSKLSKRDEADLLSVVNTERGGKVGIEFISLLRKQVADTKDQLLLLGDTAGAAAVTTISVLEDLQRKINESAGFVFRSAAQLALTPLNQLKSVKAALEATLVESFNALAPQLLVISQQLKDTFGSQEFKNAVQNTALAFANLTVFVVKNIDAFGLLLGAVAAFKLGSLGAGLVSGLVLGLEKVVVAASAARVAILGLGAAQASAGVAATATGAATAIAATGFARFAAFLGPVGFAIGAAATAYQLYSLFSEKASKSNTQIADVTGKSLLEHYDKEIARVKEINLALTRNISLEQLRREEQSAASRQEFQTSVDSDRNRAKDLLTAAQNRYENTPAVITGRGGVKNLEAGKSAASALAAAQANFKATDRIAKEKEELLATRERTFQAISEDNAARTEANAKARLKTDRDAVASAKELTSSQLGTLEQAEKRKIELGLSAQRQRQEIQELAQSDEEKALKRQYDRGLVDFGAYQNALTELQSRGEKRRIEDLQAEIADEVSGVAKLAALSEAASKARDVQGGQKAANEIEAIRQKIEKLGISLVKLNSAADNRLADSLTEALKPATDILRAAEKQEGLENLAIERELEKLKVKTNVKQLSEQELFVEAQTSQILGKKLERLASYQELFEELKRSGPFQADQLVEGSVNLEKFKEFEKLIAKLKAELAGKKLEITPVLNADFVALETDKLAGKIKDDLVGGILSAGKDGGAGLRKSLQDALIRRPLRIFLDAVLNPISQSLAGGLLGGFGQAATGAASSGGGGLGTITSAISAAGSSFGSSALASLQGTLGFGKPGSLGFTEAITTGFSTLATGTAAGISSGLGAIAGAAAPYVLGALILARLTRSKGGPKESGAFGPAELERGSLDSDAERISKLLQSQYDGLVTALGGNSSVTFGAGITRDPRGTAPNFAQVRALQNGNQLFNELDLNAGRTDESLAAAVADLSSRALLTGLQASDIAEKFRVYLDTYVAESLDTETVVSNLNILAAGNNAFKQFSRSIEQLGDYSLHAQQKIINLSGGLETLTSRLEGYYTNFYTEDERRARTTQNLIADLGALGLALPATREGFRALVEAQIALGDNGLETLSVLLANADAFASIRPAAANAQEAVEALRDTLSSALDDARSRTDAAFAALERAVNVQRSLAQEQIDSISAVLSAIGDNVKDLYGEVDSTRAQSAIRGSAFISEALSAAQLTGYLPDGDALSDAISAARGEQVFASQADSDFQRLVLAGQLSQLEGLAGDQLTEAEQTLKALDDSLLLAQAQIDAVRGVDTSVISVAQAVRELGAALSAERAAAVAAIAGGVEGVAAPLQDPLLGSNPAQYGIENLGFQFAANGGSRTDQGYLEELARASAIAGFNDVGAYDRLINSDNFGDRAGLLSGISQPTLSDYEQQIRDRQIALNGGVPFYEQGTPYVPRDGLAYLHQGEAVLTREENRGGGSSGNSAVVAELRSMNAAMDRRLASIERSNQRTAEAVNGNADSPFSVVMVP